MSRDLQVRWRAVPHEALVWREWGDEVVVFNQETGSTHLFGELAGEILRRLMAERDVTVEAIAARLVDDTSGIDHTDWTKTVLEVLSDFRRLGLARPEGP